MQKRYEVCCVPVNPTLVPVSVAGFTFSASFHFSLTLLIIWFSKNFSFLGQVAGKREVVETLPDDSGKSLGLFQFF